MADATAIALIVAGTGATTDVEVSDLLNDAYGDADPDLIVPVDKDLFSDTVQNVIAWFDDDDHVIPVQTEGASMSRKSSRYGDPDVLGHLRDLFTDKFEGFEEVHFLVALPEDTDSPEFDYYVDLVEAAIENKIRVRDLTGGLDDVRLADPEAESEANPVEEKAAEPEPEPEKPKRSRRKTAEKSETASVEEDVAAAKRAADVARERRAADLSPDVEEALKAVAEAAHFLLLNDIMFAKRQQTEDVEHSPLTAALVSASKVLKAALGGSPGPEQDSGGTEAPAEEEKPAEAPRRGRGRPRTNTPEEKQIWDEDTEEWVKRPRGRIAKGTKTRTINPETDEVLEEGEV